MGKGKINPQQVNSNRILYTPSNFARSTLLYLQEVGSLRALKEHTSSRENLDSFLFFQIVKGEGMLMYNSTLYFLQEGDCVFIDCSVPYYHKTSSDLWELEWIHFNGKDMHDIYNKYLSRGGTYVFKSNKNYVELITKIKWTAEKTSSVRDMELNALLANLLTYLMDDNWNPDRKSEGKKNRVDDVKTYIDINFKEEIRLDKLAGQFAINKTYLAEMFKEKFGVGINEYLNSVRITEAKKLLRFTDKTMEVIADNVGVSGTSYFSRLFKKFEGISPKEYRKMW